MSFKTVTHYANLAAAAPVNTKTITPLANESYVVYGISFTAPANDANFCQVMWDGAIVDEAQQSCFKGPVKIIAEGDNVKQLLLTLDNSSGVSNARLGITIYYEQIG